MVKIFFPNLFLFLFVGLVAADKVFVVYGANYDVLDKASLKAYGAQIRHEFADSNAVSAEIPIAAIEALQHNPNIASIEPVGIAYILGKGGCAGSKPCPTPTPTPKPTSTPTPSPTSTPTPTPSPTPTPTPTPGPNSTQVTPWGITKVKAPLAWSSSTGSGVKILVADTGVQAIHPDLAGHLGWCKSYVTATCDDDATSSHGTHVSGTILAADNSFGVVGVAPSATLYMVKVCNLSGICYVDDMAAALEDARLGPDGLAGTGDEADIVSMSIGGTALGAVFESQMQQAYAAGITLVAAAGNDGQSNGIDYPAKYPEFIAVGAIDSTSVIASFSDRGPELEVVAPGVSVYSTIRGSSYGYLSGTSMATPHVSGVIALMKARNHSLTPLQIRNILHSTSFDLGATGFDNMYGYGLVDAQAAVQAS